MKWQGKEQIRNLGLLLKKKAKGEVFNQKRTVKKRRFTLKKAVILK